MVHDCALDFSGRRAASCGSDRLVKVFDLGGVGGGGAASAPVLLAEIAAHEGPVWAVAWAHPRFGTLLASASYDGTVAVHREAPAAAPATNVRGAPAATAASSSVVLATGAGSTSASRPGGGAWPRVLSFEGHAASVNGLAWAPQELGLCLATASADGKVAVITHHGMFCITMRERIPSCYPDKAETELHIPLVSRTLPPPLLRLHCQTTRHGRTKCCKTALLA